MADYDFFVTIVAGDNPEELMKQYDKNITVEPYVVYKYKDAELIKKRYLELLHNLLNAKTVNKEEKEEIMVSIDEINDTSAEDFYFDFTDEYMLDPKTGDALCDKNKNGKWSYYQIGKFFSVPFITKDGDEKFQAHKKDIDWDKIHLANQDTYITAWELVMDKRPPKDEREKKIYENLKTRNGYFEKFKTKENYVVNSTAFWGYAFLSEKTGWVQLEDNQNQFEWVSNFFNNFIKPLDENTLLTIYETHQ